MATAAVSSLVSVFRSMVLAEKKTGSLQVIVISNPRIPWRIYDGSKAAAPKARVAIFVVVVRPIARPGKKVAAGEGTAIWGRGGTSVHLLMWLCVGFRDGLS